MNIFRLLESFDGSEQLDGWQERNGNTAHTANVGNDAYNAAYNILELTPSQWRQLERDGEIAIDAAGGGVTHISL